MNKNTNTTTQSTTVETKATKVRQPRQKSAVRIALDELITTLKSLSTARKDAKKKLVATVDAAYAEYKKYIKETYKPTRKAAIAKFNEVKTAAKAERKAKREEAAKLRAERDAERAAKKEAAAKAKAEKAAAKPVAKKTVTVKKAIGAKEDAPVMRKAAAKKVEAKA